MMSVGSYIFAQVKVIKCLTWAMVDALMPYDLLWPYITRLDASILEAKVVEKV